MSTATLPSPGIQTQESRTAALPAWTVINLMALTCAAVALRAWKLSNIPGVNGDEAWTAVQALRWLHDQPVDWRTPNGNVLNPFYLLPTLALHASFAPSFFLLRLTALLSGLVALPLNYWLCGRAYGRTTAWVSTTLLALLPINIAYSRFGWDASQSVLAVLPVLYLPLGSRGAREPASGISALAVALLAAAILVHPTNVFAAPLIVAPLLVARRQAIVDAWHNTAIRAHFASLSMLVVASLAAAYGVSWAVLHLGSHLYGIADAPAFAANYLELFSGVTVLSFVAGSTLETAPGVWACLAPCCNACCALVAAAATIGWGLGWRRKGLTPRDTALLFSWGSMLVGFFLVAGPRALEPHFERYGMCLVAPAVLVVARGLVLLVANLPRSEYLWAGLTVAAWFWPVAFYLGYFVFIESTGGQSHDTFRTASVEPKLQAFQLVEAARDPRRPTVVVCREFWNYWPLAYLAGGTRDVQIVTIEQWQSGAATAKTAESAQVWFVEFARSEAAAKGQPLEPIPQNASQKHVISDYAGRPILSVFGPAEKLSQNY